MKPRNERERKCVALSAKLPSLTFAQIDYAYKNCFVHKALPKSRKHGTWYCLDCGEVFEADAKARKFVCPHCHSKLFYDDNNHEYHDTQTFQIITTIEGYQVIRTFFIRKDTKRGQKSMHWMTECVQRFMKPGQKDVVIALKMGCFPHYRQMPFIDYSDMSIKDDSATNLYSNHPYNFWATAVYPRQSVLPVIKRNGYCRWLKEKEMFKTAYDRLLNPHYETIAKAGRFDIWKELSDKIVNKYWPQIKMLIRHDYHPQDMKIWEDTVLMADELGYDIYSPKFTLPADLFQIHDWLVRRKGEQERKKEIERNRQKEKQFQDLYGRFLGICIVEKDITIRPLQNYADFYDEGKTMHHCVVSYFGREGSLILSARQGNKRLATIELNTKNFNVEQCRAICNQRPERYDEIVGILASHKKDFLRAKRAKRVA